MSFRVNGIVVIAKETDMKCELCGSIEETRPYGPRGERICYDCGQKNQKVTQRQINQKLFGEPIQ